MEFQIPWQERWVLWTAVLFCAGLDLFLIFSQTRSRTEPVKELFFRLVGSNFFFLYFAYRLALRLHYSVGPASHWTAWLDWALNVSPFLIFGLSYVIRIPARSPASGLRESLFPFFCVLLPVGVYESEALGSYFLNSHPSWATFFRRFPIDPWGPWKWVSQGLIVFGNLLTIAGLVYLRKSFSIMAEAREFIHHGPYRFIRHPIYLGESLATAGWFILKPSGFSLSLTLVFIFAQRARAYFEEKKLQGIFPEYSRYREKTGAYFWRPS